MWRRRVHVLALVTMLGVVGPAVAQAEPQGPESVAALAAQLSPAVVNIGTSRRLPGGGGTPFPEFPPGSPLEDLFDQLNPNQGQGRERMEEARSLGSGFIISADGYVVTNDHVIEGADEIYVFLVDGRRLPAVVAGRDDKTDLAVLKVDAGGPLPFVEFGDSDSAEVGDWVMAIGNPFGLGGTVTLGIVSARNRNINAGPYDDFIQTDASINQGSSGGPLFDMQGKVIGINTAIIARGFSSLGIGFAVPVNLARPVVTQLAEFGETRRGWLGVGIQEVSADMALSLARPNAAGAMVVDIDPAGPAVGLLHPGDLILRFDGKDVVQMRDLPRIVAGTEVGRAVPVVVLREGVERTIDVTLGRLEAPMAVAAVPPSAPPPFQPQGEQRGLPGLQVGDLDAETRDRFGFGQGVSGPIITAVAAGSDAQDKGLSAGLVISEVNQNAVATAEDVEKSVAEARAAGRLAVLLRVLDPAGASRYVAVRID